MIPWFIQCTQHDPSTVTAEDGRFFPDEPSNNQGYKWQEVQHNTCGPFAGWAGRERLLLNDDDCLQSPLWIIQTTISTTDQTSGYGQLSSQGCRKYFQPHTFYNTSVWHIIQDPVYIVLLYTSTGIWIILPCLHLLYQTFSFVYPMICLFCWYWWT